MNETAFVEVLLRILELSRICGCLCCLALLILLFLIPTIFATDSRGELDKESESPQAKQDIQSGRLIVIGNNRAALNEILAREQRKDMYRAVTVLLILAALHTILIWGIFSIIDNDNKSLVAKIIFVSYPVLEIVWYVLFLKTLFAKMFREPPCFEPARIICVINLIPIAVGDVLLIPLILFGLFIAFLTRNISWT